MDERRGRGQKLRSEGLDRFISLMSKSKVGKARCKNRSSGGGGGQRGGGGGQGADGRQGWQGRRAGSSNSIHGCVQVGCRAGRCFVVPLGLGLGLAWTVSLGVTGATGVCTLVSWLEKLLEYLGTEGMTILDRVLGSGLWVCVPLGLGLGLLSWFVLGWLHAMQYVCSGCNTTQQFSIAQGSYTVRYGIV